MDDVFTSVEGRPKRHQGITGQTIEAQMRGTMCQITEYELDVLREGIARLTALVDARTGECQAKAQIIALLEAERDAIAAAAFEVAAGLPRDPNWVWRFEPRWSARDLSEAIRALTPADAQAAIDKLLAEARLEGWRAGRDAAAEHCWEKRSGLADAEQKQVAAGLTGRDYYGRRLEAELLSRSIRALPEPKEASHD